MSRLDIRQQVKNEALNEIMKCYGQYNVFQYDEFSHKSYVEQRDAEVQNIIECLSMDLERI